jgi:hypothetical protein
MEPTKAQMRLVLVLGKFRVTDKTETTMKLALGGSTTMTISIPPYADVRPGDLLTLYTEVLYAQPSKPPIQ